jgi:phage tail-like protein
MTPFPAFNFYITLIDTSSTFGKISTAASLVGAAAVTAGIDAVPVGGFSECSGLDVTMQVEEYPEGGENRFVHRFPTRITYSNITLKRGVGFAEDLWNWHFDYVNGKGKRRDGLIMLHDEQHIPIKVWSFKRGLPVKWSGPTLNASQSALAIESLEIAHEGLELTSPGTLAAQAGAAISAAF